MISPVSSGVGVACRRASASVSAVAEMSTATWREGRSGRTLSAFTGHRSRVDKLLAGTDHHAISSRYFSKIAASVRVG